MSISGIVGCFVVGVMSLFSLDIVKAARIIDTITSVISAVAVSDVVKTGTTFRTIETMILSVTAAVGVSDIRRSIDMCGPTKGVFARV